VYYYVRKNGEEYVRWLQKDNRLNKSWQRYLNVALGDRQAINSRRHKLTYLCIAVANGHRELFDPPLSAGEWGRLPTEVLRLGTDPMTRYDLVRAGITNQPCLFSRRDIAQLSPQIVAEIPARFIKTHYGVFICPTSHLDHIKMDVTKTTVLIADDGEQTRFITGYRKMSEWVAIYIAAKIGNTRWMNTPAGAPSTYRCKMPIKHALAIERAGWDIECICGDFFAIHSR
jgi:hypothetical protein